MNWVIHQAFKHHINNNVVDIDDLKQIGAIALLKAIRSFDPSKGVKLGTFAWTCIIRDIRKEIKRFNRLRSISIETIDNNLLEELNHISSLWELLPTTLNQKELQIIESRLEGKSLSEIGKELGYSKEWINKILSVAINKIRVSNE